MNVHTEFDWRPDPALPGRARDQAFTCHAHERSMRIHLDIDGRAELEVNERVVVEADGFRAAEALAELYGRDGEMLLSPRHGQEPAAGPYYRLLPAEGGYQVHVAADPAALIEAPGAARPIVAGLDAGAALEAAWAHAPRPLQPVFFDQRELYLGLGQSGAGALLVSAWVACWQPVFVGLLDEEEYSPLHLDYGKAGDGACYTVYRLVNREFLAEFRSHHCAEEIGRFERLAAARGACSLFNAAHRGESWVRFPHGFETAATSLDGAYALARDGAALRLSRIAGAEAVIGALPSLLLAEAYATAHRDALAHFVAAAREAA